MIVLLPPPTSHLTTFGIISPRFPCARLTHPSLYPKTFKLSPSSTLTCLYFQAREYFRRMVFSPLVLHFGIQEHDVLITGYGLEHKRRSGRSHSALGMDVPTQQLRVASLLRLTRKRLLEGTDCWPVCVVLNVVRYPILLCDHNMQAADDALRHLRDSFLVATQDAVGSIENFLVFFFPYFNVLECVTHASGNTDTRFRRTFI